MEELRQALESFDQAQARDFLPETYGYLAEASLLRGDLEAAETHGQRSIELARELNMPREEGHSLRILGEIALAQGQFADANGFLTSSYDVLTTAATSMKARRPSWPWPISTLRQQQIQEAATALAECHGDCLIVWKPPLTWSVPGICRPNYDRNDRLIAKS